MNFLPRVPELISGLTLELGQRWGTTVGQTVLFDGVCSLPFLRESGLQRVSPQLLHHGWREPCTLGPAVCSFRCGVFPLHLGLSQDGSHRPSKASAPPQPDQAPCSQWEIQKLTFLKKGPTQIKHVDGVSKPVCGLTGRCTDGKSRLLNSSAVILSEQRCRKVQEL